MGWPFSIPLIYYRFAAQTQLPWSRSSTAASAAAPSRRGTGEGSRGCPAPFDAGAVLRSRFREIAMIKERSFLRHRPTPGVVGGVPGWRRRYVWRRDRRQYRFRSSAAPPPPAPPVKESQPARSVFMR